MVSSFFALIDDIATLLDDIIRDEQGGVKEDGERPHR
jgi:predicted DNA repair protein MutK